MQFIKMNEKAINASCLIILRNAITGKKFSQRLVFSVTKYVVDENSKQVEMLLQSNVMVA